MVRFDFFPTIVNPISWKEGVDSLPEFDMDFEHTHFLPIVEKKPVVNTLTKEKENAYYYPGFIFVIKTIRDPFPKIFRAFIPCIILGLFLY